MDSGEGSGGEDFLGLGRKFPARGATARDPPGGRGDRAGIMLRILRQETGPVRGNARPPAGKFSHLPAKHIRQPQARRFATGMGFFSSSDKPQPNQPASGGVTPRAA